MYGREGERGEGGWEQCLTDAVIEGLPLLTVKYVASMFSQSQTE